MTKNREIHFSLNLSDEILTSFLDIFFKLSTQNVKSKNFVNHASTVTLTTELTFHQ